MKGRESGMPSEEYWGTFFEADTAGAYREITVSCDDIQLAACG